MKKQIIFFIIALFVILVTGSAGCQPLTPASNQNANVAVITNFDECVAAGNPVMESYPRRCNANGQTFSEYIGNELEKIDLIRIDSPRPNAVVASPLEITGQARGIWYFEASFSVKLLDANGEEITLKPPYIMTTENWMTEEFVPFKATIEFSAPSTATGTLILEKGNPSGLPENDDSLIVPVKFR